MKTATQALIWRQWRMSRYPALGVCAGALALITVDVLLHAIHLITEEEMAIGSFGVAIGSVWFAFYTLFQGSDLNNLTPSFPAGLYRLPVRSAKLAVIELGGRTLASLFVFLIMLLALAAAHGLTTDQDHAPFRAEYLAQPVIVLFGCVAAYSALQALLWCPFGAQAVVCAIAAALFVGPVRSMIPSSLEMLSRVEALPFTAAILVGSYGIAIAAVRYGRGGVPTSGVSDLSLRFRRNRTPFRSPLSAQCWMEWRSFGSMIPSLAFLLTSAVAICVHQMFVNLGSPMQDNGHQGLGFAVAAMTMVFSPILLSVSAVLAGTLLFVRDWKERGGALSFVMVRPLPTHVLASARLRTGMASILGSILVLSIPVFGLLFMIASSQAAPFLRETLGVDASSSLAAAILMHLALVVLVGWVLLWLGVPALGALVLVIYPLAILAHFALTLGAPESAIVFAAVLTTYLIAAGVILGCAACAWKGLKNRSMSRRGIAMAIAAWAIVGTLLLYSAYSQSILPSLGDPAHSLKTTLIEQSVIWGLASLSAIPFVSVPLTLNRVRHR